MWPFRQNKAILFHLRGAAMFNFLSVGKPGGCGWLTAKPNWSQFSWHESSPKKHFFFFWISSSFDTTHTRKINPDAVPPGGPTYPVIEFGGNSAATSEAQWWISEAGDGWLSANLPSGQLNVPSEACCKSQPPRSHWFLSFRTDRRLWPLIDNNTAFFEQFRASSCSE